MAPEKRKEHKDHKEPKAARQDFEAAYGTKALGRPLQRKLLQRRLADFSESAITPAAGHGEESSPDARYASPPEDRAG